MARQRKARSELWVSWKMSLVVPRPTFALWVLLSKSEDGVRLRYSLRERRVGRRGKKRGGGGGNGQGVDDPDKALQR